MHSQLKRVIQRLCYEGYMRSTEFHPAKTQFSLRDIMDAGVLEPRLYEILPGIVRFDPTIIRNLKRDLRLNPKIKRSLENVERGGRQTDFFGVPYEDCIKQMRVVEKIWAEKSAGSKIRNLNIRVSQQDLERLSRLSQRHKKSKSEVIRDLLSSQVV